MLYCVKIPFRTGSSYGQLGNNGTGRSSVPVLVDRTGVLAGKTVVAVAGGGGHSLALRSDGSLAAWGTNFNGQLGTGNHVNSKVPVAVDLSGVLAGKKVIAIAAGANHNLALCTDGTLAAWGSNASSQLGNNGTAESTVPVLVDRNGVLAGKTVIAIAAGDSHNLALCADGTLAAWGFGGNGELGNNSLSTRSVPILVNRSGVLAGKTISAINAGYSQSLALCTDGTLAAWGSNNHGQLGNDSTTQSSVPVLVNTSQLRSGERFVAAAVGESHCLALVASPPPPLVTTLAAGVVTDTGATLHGSVNANGNAASVSFEYGLTSAYGRTAAATPAAVTGTTASEATATLTGLLSGATYHYRLIASSIGGTVKGADVTFTTSTLAGLASLSTNRGALLPAFDTNIVNYAIAVPFEVPTITFTPSATRPETTVTAGGIPVESGTASSTLGLSEGDNRIDIVVTAGDGIITKTYTVTVIRLPEVLEFNSATGAPVTAGEFRATGLTASFGLNFPPPAGTILTVVRNTGSNPIQGTFANLAQGQLVDLTHAGLTYRFVANYYGGTGNDLVLQWANTRILAWGYNLAGQLGTATTTQSPVPVAVNLTGVLAGKTIIALAAGGNHSLALCADGTLAAWGSNSAGQLGIGSYPTSSSVPVLVNTSGVLAGRRIIAVAAGVEHSIALCADGSVATWGDNSSGQLGSQNSAGSPPGLVNQSGVLAGKTVVAVAAGSRYNLVLCSDGSLVAWGRGGTLQEDNLPTPSTQPVLVRQSGALEGRTIAAVAAGDRHALALCTDGTVVAWGDNFSGQLGDGSFVTRSAQVLVDRNGVLAGKTVTAVRAGSSHSMALCSDGTLVAWGEASRVGTNRTTNSNVPVLVDKTGVLAGKTVAGLAAGSYHSVALCADGSLAAWGSNSNGRLGNNSTVDSNVPVLVNSSGLLGGERFMPVMVAAWHTLALTALPPPPVATTLAAAAVADTGATVNGVVNAQGGTTTVSFQYGLTTAYGTTVAATPASLTGGANTPVSATLSGLKPRTTYHFRVRAANAGGTATGQDMTFTTEELATLSGLTLSSGTLSPAFGSSQLHYGAVVPFATSEVSVTAVAASAASTLRINGVTLTSGAAAGPFPLAVGNNLLTVTVSSADGLNFVNYSVTVTRVPDVYAWASGNAVPVTASGFQAGGLTAGFALNFAPAVGASLTMVKNTGDDFIQGTFSNLAQGQRVNLTFGGITYPFVANYFGGTGNDLVLQWANARVFAWGANFNYRLGIVNAGSSVEVPTPVDPSEILTNNPVLALAAGGSHIVALCADGRLAAWGANSNGQVGNGVAGGTVRNPVQVDRTGVLANKTVAAIAVGSNHTLALCADGTLAAWGLNSSGQLGNNQTADAASPVLVDRSGALAGKRVVAVGAGELFSLALCSDGSVAAWGANDSGQLGNNSTTNNKVPVAVDQTGALNGKRVVALSTKVAHTLAVSADGTLVAWGANTSGQLGNGLLTNSLIPVTVNGGALAGKSVIACAAGKSHSLVLRSDGAMVAWGSNAAGQIGTGTATYDNIPTPTIVSPPGAVSGKTVVAVTAGTDHNLALCSDGTLAAWGWDAYGQLGHNVPNGGSTPTAVSSANLKPGERFMNPGIAASFGASVGQVASPPAPAVTTAAATGLRDDGATLNAGVQPNGSNTTVTFEYGLTTAYGSTVTGTPDPVTGAGIKAVTGSLGGLLSGTTYHYRAVATNPGGTAIGEDMSFTTTTLATLSALSLSRGTLAPAFDSTLTSYIATVPFAAVNITLTPVTTHAAATVKVAATSVASGTASSPVPLAVGNNTVTVEVTAGNGIDTTTYRITVTRLPERFTFDSPGAVPVTVGDFIATGNAPPFVLGHAPRVGTSLRVVNNTGLEPIRGTFDNLAQGQPVAVEFGGITYPLVANYFGGTGNDLELAWGSTRVFGWGAGGDGRLGIGSTTSQTVPGPVDASGVLAGKAIKAVTAGEAHSLALAWDGTLAAWGDNQYGQLGNSNTTDQLRPAAVTSSGVLAGKRIIAIAAGDFHSLALCADGTLAAWGYNSYGQLGNNSLTNSSVPTAVVRTGVLAGKTIVELAAGSSLSVARCSDGTVATWGRNTNGQLGNNITTSSQVPVLVNTAGVLAGKTVVAVSAGSYHCLALCSDGTFAGWGGNTSGQVGDSDSTDRSVPVLVDRSGVLAGKTIAWMAGGRYHSVVSCSDGTVAAWGSNYNGQLGDGSTGSHRLPGWVDRSGVLAGKKVVAVAAGDDFSVAQCDDDSTVAWGANGSGQLGNNSTTQSLLPVLVDTGLLRPGERFMPGIRAAVYGRDYARHSLAVVASPPPPGASTLAASAIMGTGATLNGSVNAAGAEAAVSFEYGLTSSYGTTVAAVPATVSGSMATSVSGSISGLIAGTTYHYRVVASNSYGMTHGVAMTFTTLSDNAKLAALGLGSGTLVPGFDKHTMSYAAAVPFATDSVTATPTTEHPAATVRVNGVAVVGGAASGVMPLVVGNNTITVVVTADDGVTSMSYFITVTRLPENFVFNSASDVPLTANGFAAGGHPINLVLGYAPTPGAVLTMVNNTGLGFIFGRFGNLAQGQRVTLTYSGTSYDFSANYHGGTGNDLVLQWANTELLAWGGNGFGQLGDNTTTRRLLPTPVNDTGVLADKTAVAVAGGYLHSLALCADGTLAAWGYNVFGQLGNGSAVPSSVPVAVDRTGALAGKTVVAIAAGPFHNLALCSDGTVVAWGNNTYGQLGDGTTVTRRVPVRVSPIGALAGKQVVAVAAAAYSSVALCDDGTVAAWGYNDEGELGNGTTTTSLLPVMVNTSGALSGKRVAALAAGQYHTLALCTDGTLVSWGYNNRGQLGNNSTTNSSQPVAIGSFGTLAGKVPEGITAGAYHSLARCADGTVAAWGANNLGQLGATGTTASAVPIAVSLAAAAQIAADGSHSLARGADGTLFAWGDNTDGQLGDNSTTSRATPVAVDFAAISAGIRVMAVAAGSAARHNLALVALPVGIQRTQAATGNTGLSAADELLREAFGLDAGALPQPQREGADFVIRFTQPAGVAGIRYGAEWSATLQPDSWQDVPDTGADGEHCFAIPAAGLPQGFLRLKVTRE